MRAEFFKFIRAYPDLHFHAVIARKELTIFNRKHNSNPAEFYFDIVHHLLHERLLAGCDHTLYLAQKQKNSQDQFVKAIEKSIYGDLRRKRLEERPDYTCSIVPSSQMPELSVVDYLLWALQRYLLQGESRFWEAIEHRVGSVADLYDNQKLYDGQTNPLRLEKMKPFV